jgi:hypothetical protein
VTNNTKFASLFNQTKCITCFIFAGIEEGKESIGGKAPGKILLTFSICILVTYLSSSLAAYWQEVGFSIVQIPCTIGILFALINLVIDIILNLPVLLYHTYHILGQKNDFFGSSFCSYPYILCKQNISLRKVVSLDFMFFPGADNPIVVQKKLTLQCCIYIFYVFILQITQEDFELMKYAQSRKLKVGSVRRKE